MHLTRGTRRHALAATIAAAITTTAFGGQVFGAAPPSDLVTSATQPATTGADDTASIPPDEAAFIQQVAEEYLVGLFDLDGDVEPVDVACAVSYAPALSATGGTCYATIARTSSIVVAYIVHQDTQVTASIAGEYVSTGEGSFPEYANNPDYEWTFTTTAPTVPAPAPTAPAPTAPTAPAPAPAPSEWMTMFVVELSNVRTEINVIDLEHLCVDIAATNTGNLQVPPLGSWSAVRPSGVVSFDSAVLTSDGTAVSTWFPVVVPGAVSRGTKCFETGDERGEFTVQYQELGRVSGSWTFELP